MSTRSGSRRSKSKQHRICQNDDHQLKRAFHKKWNCSICNSPFVNKKALCCLNCKDIICFPCGETTGQEEWSGANDCSSSISEDTTSSGSIIGPIGGKVRVANERFDNNQNVRSRSRTRSLSNTEYSSYSYTTQCGDVASKKQERQPRPTWGLPPDSRMINTRSPSPLDPDPRMIKTRSPSPRYPDPRMMTRSPPPRVRGRIDKAGAIDKASANKKRYELERKQVEELKKGKLAPPKVLRLRKQNKCLIISNKFEGKKALSGYKIDERNIRSTFQTLNFQVETKTDLSAAKMKKEFEAYKRYDFSNEECFMTFILTHGDSNRKIQGSDSKVVQLDYIINVLSECVSLYGKPKLIFVQACRGNTAGEYVRLTRGTRTGTQCEEIQEPLKSKGKEPKFIVKSKDADTLVYYSTTEGRFSYVSEETGSFFVQAVCKVFNSYGRKYPLSSIITKINEIVSRHVVTQDDEVYVEACEVSHRLTCDIFFSSNRTPTPEDMNFRTLPDSGKLSLVSDYTDTDERKPSIEERKSPLEGGDRDKELVAGGGPETGPLAGDGPGTAPSIIGRAAAPPINARQTLLPRIEVLEKLVGALIKKVFPESRNPVPQSGPVPESEKGKSIESTKKEVSSVGGTGTIQRVGSAFQEEGAKKSPNERIMAAHSSMTSVDEDILNNSRSEKSFSGSEKSSTVSEECELVAVASGKDNDENTTDIEERAQCTSNDNRMNPQPIINDDKLSVKSDISAASVHEELIEVQRKIEENKRLIVTATKRICSEI